MSFTEDFVKTGSISGTGGGIVGVEVFGPRTRGTIRALTLRLTTGGAITDLDDLFMVHNTTGISLSAIPPRENVTAILQAIALTASGTAASFASRVDKQPIFAGGLAFILQVSGGGAVPWTIRYGLEVGPLRGADVP